MDVMLICPVFWEGELFCWVTNCLHQYDIGGITPGSFCPSAKDAFDERAVQQDSGLAAPGEIANLLAREKALFVSSQMPGRFVVGADQTLALGNRLFSKPGGRVQAA